MRIKSMMKGMLAVVMAMSRQHAPEHLQQTRLLLSHRHRHRQKVQQQQSRKHLQYLQKEKWKCWAPVMVVVELRTQFIMK